MAVRKPIQKQIVRTGRRWMKQIREIGTRKGKAIDELKGMTGRNGCKTQTPPPSLERVNTNLRVKRRHEIQLRATPIWIY